VISTELEQPLCVRLGVTSQFGDLRQTRPDEGDREFSLHHLVKCFDERFELHAIEELDLVEE
jgi:hypothetical protein